MIMVFEEHPLDGSAKKCESAMNALTRDGQGGISRNNAVGLEPPTAAHNLPLCFMLFYS